jgi:hypothetical protein
LHAGSLWQLTVHQSDCAAFHNSFKLLGAGRSLCGRVARGHTGWAAGSSCTLVHRLIRQLVRFAVVFSQRVVDGEPLQLRNQLFGAGVKFLQRQVLHFVDAFDLPYQEFGIAYDLERFVSVLDGILERRNQTLIFREVVGLVTQVLAERGNFSSGFILNYNAITGGTGIASSSAIAVGDQVVLGSFDV